MTDFTIYTPSNLFSNVDFSLDTDSTVIKTAKIDGVTIKDIYFSAREIKGKRPRGYGKLGLCKDINAPLLVIIGDTFHSLDENIMIYYVKQNFSVLMFDYTGEDTEKTKYTFYPPEIDFANLVRADRHLNFADNNARNTCNFEWATLGHYAITAAISLLEYKNIKIGIMGIGRGANLVWMLASFDKRISACCTVFSAGWDAYKDIYKYSDDNTLRVIDDEREKWLAGVSCENYAKMITVPMLYISSTNCQDTHMERAYDTLSRIPDANNTLCCFSPKLSDIIGNFNTKNISLFFKKFLLADNIEIPKKATVNIENINGKIAVNVVCENISDIKQITVFCCEGEINPAARNWFFYPVDLTAENLTVYPKVNFSDSILFAFSNIIYKNGFTLSTNLCVKKISKFEIELPPYRRSQLLYNSEMGKDCFTVYSNNKLKLSKIFLNECSVTLKTGAGGIFGITALSDNLATYKVGDKSFKGYEDESFKFDVYSSEPQELTVYFLDKIGTGEERQHFYKIKLLGGNIWHPVEIKKQNLKTAEGHILKSWEEVSMAVFSAENEFLVNNILWI